MRRLSWVLIAAGIIIGLVPIIGQLYTSYRQNALIEELEHQRPEQQEDVAEEIDSQIQDYVGLQDVFREEDAGSFSQADEPNAVSSPSGTSSETAVVPKDTPSKPPDKTAPKPSQKVLGKIKIEKIKVDVPIVEGVKPENLKIAVGHIPGTAAIGEMGNCALAGHRSYTFGKFFNRLNELEEGDKIVITVKDATHTYTVYKKHIVEPTDVSVLKGNKTEKVLTLITCEPIYVASHRLIIHAKME